jgi:hypothetical protein
MSQSPPRCHFDRDLGERVTREHRDDCDHPQEHRGCAPCTAPHCILCGREHADNDHPLTCSACIGVVRDDLDDIRWLARQVPAQAAFAGGDGRLAAAAPIPGGDAMVFMGPSVDAELVLTSRSYDDDHRRGDPVPPLAVLAHWEDQWRTWLDHTAGRRASLNASARYLADQLTYMAQQTAGPDFPEFARAVRQVRVSLERVLHDEREPERGVECFECGERLVRRFRPARPCRHIEEASRRGVAPSQWLYLLSTYPELEDSHDDCTQQGGIDDPDPGMSWECPGCRKQYTAGEYVTAVRRDLLDTDQGGLGWTDIEMAANAASTLADRTIAASTVRKWMDRGKVRSLCLWTPGRRWGQRLVYWPDVADRTPRSLGRTERAS